uniref:Uncharacterized protein n=1 Tax=Bracon brevicornis TaxID=1563983 RepID=A0A6V7JSG0_9HYME
MGDNHMVNGEKFWEMVRSETGIDLSTHVKKILTSNGIDDPVALGGITTQTVDEVEAHARDVLKELLDPEEDLKFIYGLYHRKPEKFQFNVGEWNMIVKLAQLVADKSVDFGRPKRETITIPTNKREGEKKRKLLTMSGQDNIANERETLTSRIKSMVNPFCEKENILEQAVVWKVSVNDLSVIVKVNEQYEGENLSESLS